MPRSEEEYRVEWAAPPDQRLIDAARDELARIIMRRVLGDLRGQAGATSSKPNDGQER